MKRLKLVVIPLLLVFILVGCGSKGPDENATKEITVWAHPYSGDNDAELAMWDEIIKEYEEKTGVKVNFEQIPWANRDQKILVALAANQGPDVFYAIPDQMPQYADKGMLLDMSDYMKDNDMDDFVPSALAATTWDGKLYGLPILQEAYTMIYNEDIIKAIGEDPENLPATWEEFEDWAAKAKEKGFYAMGYGGGGSLNSTFYPFLWQAGGDVLSADSEVLINSPESVKAFEMINKMYTNGWIPKDSITAMDHRAMFESGEVLASQSSGILITHLTQSKAFEFKIAAPLKDKEQATYGSAGMFVVPSITKNADAAVEFVKTATNSESQKKFNTVTQYIPTRESAKTIFDDQPNMKQLAGYTQFVKSGVIHPIGRNVMPGITAPIQAMLEGTMTPQEAADAAAASVQKELDKQ